MDVSSQLQKCYATYQANDFQNAEQQYQNLTQHIVSGNMTYGDTHHLGALIASKFKQYDIALYRIDCALKSIAEHHEYHNTKATILSTQQNIPLAIISYQTALDLKPDFLSAARSFGKLLLENGDPVAAVKVYERALKHDDKDAQLQLGYITALKDAQRLDEALSKLGTLENADKDGHLLYLRGQILFLLSKHILAKEAYEKAMQFEATSAAALRNLLQQYWMRDDWEAGQNFIDHILPTCNAPMFISIVIAYRLAEDLESARKVLTMAIEKFPNNPYLISQRARQKLEDNDIDGAWNDAVSALTLKPGDMALMTCYADCALSSGHIEEAKNAALAALKIEPNNQYWIAISYTAARALGQEYKHLANVEDFVKPYELLPPKGYDTIEAFNIALKETLNDLHEFQRHPLDQTLRNGIQTTADLRLVDHPVLKEFFKMLDAPIRAYMKMLAQHEKHADFTHPLMRRNTQNFRLTGSWSVQLKKGGFHVNHVHPQGWISSAYYVEVPDEVRTSSDKAGWIHFGEPHREVLGHDGKLLLAQKYVQPKSGTLVLFPSYMWHGTIALQGDENRMTLPFDVVPA